MLEIAALYESGLSLPDIEKRTGIPRSTVRRRLIKMGVDLRERGDAIRQCGKLGLHAIGVKRTFSPEHCAAIRKSRQTWAEKNARGVSLKPNGYLEITRGPDKGRGEHRVIMERKVGRRLGFNEVVHHRDEIKINNGDHNLELMTRAGHTSLHRKGC